MFTQIRRASARQGNRRSGPSQLVAAAVRVACERLEGRTLFSIATVPDSFTTTAGTPLIITGPSLLANDTGLGSVSGVTQPANGTVTTNDDGSFTYTPAPGFTGTDQFNYVARGGSVAVLDFLSLDGQGRARSLGQVPTFSVQFGLGRGIVSPTGSSSDREAAAPSFSDLTVTTNLSAASPKLLATVGTGGKVDRAVLTTYDSAGRVSDVLRLNGVHVTGDSLSTGGGLPSESLSLSYDEILYRHTERSGGKATVTSAGYDLAAQKETTTGQFVESDLSGSPPPLELSLGTKLDLAINSLQWGVGRSAPSPGGKPGGGSPAAPASISEVTVSATESSQSAALLSAAAAGDPMNDVTLTSRDSRGNVVAAWTLQGVLVSGFNLSSGGDTPSTSFSLNFTQITETYHQLDDKGQVTATASNTYNVGTVPPAGPGDFGQRKLTTNTLLSFQQDNGGGQFRDVGQVALNSYQWGVGRGIGSPVPTGSTREVSPPSVREFTLTTQLNLASPSLFAAVTAGSPVDRVVVTETSSSGGFLSGVTTWTLHDVVVTGDSRSVASGGNNSSGTETFSLAFDAFDYDFKKLDSSGKVQVHTTTGYDLRSEQVVNPAKLGGSTIPLGKSRLLLHLGAGADVELDSASFGTANGSDPSGNTAPVPPVLGDISVSARSGVESAAILTTVLDGTVHPDVTLTRTDANGNVVAEWDLHNVLLSGYDVSSGGGGASESFSLSPDAITLTIPATDATKPTGIGTATWDFANQKGTTTPNFGGATVAPGQGDTMEVRVGNQTSQVKLGSFNWSVANAAAGTGAPQHSVIAVTALLSGVSLGVFAAVADGQHAESVVISKRDGAGDLVETLTLNDVAFSSYSSSMTSAGASDSFGLEYGALQFAFYRDNDGKVIPPVTTPTGGWDVRPNTTAAQLSAAGATTAAASSGPETPFGGSDLSKNPPPLLINFGPGGDVAALSFQFGSGAAPGGKGVLSEFSLSARSGPESAAVLSAVEHATHIPDVTVQQRDANDNLIAEWDLHDVLVTGYAQSDGGDGSAPIESFSLSAAKVTETFFRRDAKGGLVGPPVAATWDVAQNKFISPSDFGGQPFAGSGTATGTVEVNVLGSFDINRSPTAAPVTTATFQNGPTVTAAFAGSDPDAGDTLTYSIVAPLAPSQGGVVLNNNGTFTFDPGADFNDLGLGDARSVTFTYQATDNHGASSNPAAVTIAVSGVNHAPTFAPGASQLVTDHGGPQTVAHWANGIVAGPGSESGQTLHFIVTTDNPGLFTVAPAIDALGNLTFTPVGTGLAHVTVLLQDDGGSEHGGIDTSPAAHFDIGVVDPPIHVTGQPVPAVEGMPLAGAVFATLTDEDAQATAADYIATIDYGDGTVVPATVVADPSTPGRFLVLGSTMYAEEGSAVAKVVVRDAGGSSDSTTTPVTITDAPLTPAPATIAGVEGSAIGTAVVLGSFVDGNPNAPVSDFAATIDWGDHTTGVGKVVAVGGGQFNLLATAPKTYAEEGTYAVTIRVNDVGGSSTTIQSTARIADAPLTATAVHVAARAGAPFSGPVATFTDGNAAAPLGDFTATIAWGDGTVTSGVITRTGPGRFSVAGGHVYAAAGSYATRVTILDVGGSTAQTADNSTVTILPRLIRSDQVAGHGFWHNKNGQALINSFNGGPSSTALGNWLAATLPNLFGPGAGASNTTGATNARVAALYLSLLDQSSPRLEAEILATALNVYATTSSLGGQAAAARGFFVDAYGLGASSYFTWFNGSVLGLPNLAFVNVYQVLRAADARASGGTLFAGNARLRRQANDLFDAINSGGF